MAIIQIQDVSKKFQTKDGEIDALKHVTLDIEAGDIYGIIGMSGAGKVHSYDASTISKFRLREQ